MKQKDTFEKHPDQLIMDCVIVRALTLGASVAGFVPVSLLIECPSALSAGHHGFKRDFGSVIVLGLYHDPKCPEMDWWKEGKSTPGDRILHTITTALSGWICEEFGREANDIPYAVSDGGIYLKDAAVLSGLGIIGNNNLVIVPNFGPRIRFRALWADLEVDPVSVPQYSPPCSECGHPCWKHCPQQAFPGGYFSRERCLLRMNADKVSGASQKFGTEEDKLVQHCRNCELFCVCGE